MVNVTKRNPSIIYLFWLVIMILDMFHFQALARQEDDTEKTLVFLMHIDAPIDPRMNRYVELALSEADNVNPDLVIIEMDTYGGAVTDADDIRTRIMEFDRPIYVFINKDAASAGALISIACDSIYMAPGASIGAATVVTPDGQEAPDKYQSYMRSIMRSTAEAKGRDPKIAEAMVDENLEVDSISTAGSVITFSTSEAIKYGYCEAQVTSIEEILERLKIVDYELKEFQLDQAEKIISIFLNPVVSGILILIVIGGIYFELQTPGVGFPLLASFIALVLYLTPYYLNGLAENWEIAMFFVGVALIAVEVFVIPGFGVTGALGIAFTIGSLILVMLDNDFFDFSFVDTEKIFIAVSTTLAGLLGAVIVMFFGGVRMTQTSFFKRVALEEVQDRDEGFTANFKTESFLGRKGTAFTVLRPSGKIMIDDNVYDAFTRGDFIEKGKEIEVVNEEGTSLQVKELT